QTLNAAFLILLAGDAHPSFTEAKTYLDKFSTSPDWEKTAKFYLHSAQLIAQELDHTCQQDAALKANLDQVSAALANASGNNTDQTAFAMATSSPAALARAADTWSRLALSAESCWQLWPSSWAIS
ncbi:MAG: hypothetical protein AAGI45_21030, partial [Cyanobacteria bacterium P01_H01_bin.26]